MIDLRSDTVTLPDDGMRQAMFEARLGDDVYGEDPTINELQAYVAELLGKPAALFVPSGTMSNQLALRSHTQPGDEVILDYNCHIFNYESGAGAALSGVQMNTLMGIHGIFSAEDVRLALRPKDHHYAPSRLIAIENTHNGAGGVIYPLETILAIAQVAVERGMAMHLDGARLMNAVVASGIPADRWAKPFDSISLCLSKGLGAPVGSVLAGSVAFIERAHRFRKMFGGGIRQGGMLAAAGLYALQNNVQRLAEDHHNAERLARACLELGVLQEELDWTQTNMVLMAFPKGNAPEIVRACKSEGLLLSQVNDYRIRLVTHLGIGAAEVDASIAILQKVLG